MREWKYTSETMISHSFLRQEESVAARILARFQIWKSWLSCIYIDFKKIKWGEKKKRKHLLPVGNMSGKVCRVWFKAWPAFILPKGHFKETNQCEWQIFLIFRRTSKKFLMFPWICLSLRCFNIENFMD